VCYQQQSGECEQLEASHVLDVLGCRSSSPPNEGRLVGIDFRHRLNRRPDDSSFVSGHRFSDAAKSFEAGRPYRGWGTSATPGAFARAADSQELLKGLAAGWSAGGIASADTA